MFALKDSRESPPGTEGNRSLQHRLLQPADQRKPVDYPGQSVSLWLLGLQPVSAFNLQLQPPGPDPERVQPLGLLKFPPTAGTVLPLASLPGPSLGDPQESPEISAKQRPRGEAFWQTKTPLVCCQASECHSLGDRGRGGRQVCALRSPTLGVMFRIPLTPHTLPIKPGDAVVHFNCKLASERPGELWGERR